MMTWSLGCSILVVASLQVISVHASHMDIPVTCPTSSTESCCIRQCQDTCLGTSTSLCSRSQRCVPGCLCASGFVRHGAFCVRSRRCAKFALPLPNTHEADKLREESERPIGCPGNFTATCSPQTCHFTCGNHTLLAFGTLFCKPGAQLQQPVCVCLSGYVRRGHQCVLPAECPPIRKSSPPDAGPRDRSTGQPVDVTVDPSIYSPPPNLPRPTAYVKADAAVPATTSSRTDALPASSDYTILSPTGGLATAQPGRAVGEYNTTGDGAGESSASQASLNLGVVALLAATALVYV